ncbi:hypothetical protein PsorP6_010384 [Peronosclerospora sorghi]|uniref:Uncharacterized protein n=1 Tax=Peronosclerospora sorghi TaxID=230839 RepID=A0ACC0VWU6_9STRA|nr:hypothetical protein PsorP6_010384 [Peronosclerospora sorghi]
MMGTLRHRVLLEQCQPTRSCADSITSSRSLPSEWVKRNDKNAPFAIFSSVSTMWYYRKGPKKLNSQTNASVAIDKNQPHHFSIDRMDKHRFTVNPLKELNLTTKDRAKIVEITDAIIVDKFEEYEEHERQGKKVDLGRWMTIAKAGPMTAYLERKSSDPNSNLLLSLVVGPLPGSLDENMFGIVNPTIEAMRIKTSYLKDFSAAAVLATIVEPTVDDPFRSVVVKWMEIDIPLASLGIVRNRDYVYVECTGILSLKNGDRVGYHLLHSVHFPEAPALPNRVRGNMSFCTLFHEEAPDQTHCHGTGIMDPGGDLIRSMAMTGMVNATMAGQKYSYCGQMKKLVLLLEQRQTAARESGTPECKPFCTTCTKSVKRWWFRGNNVKTCKLCFHALCRSCTIAKKLSFIAPDLTLVQRKVTFCVTCLVEATRLDTQEAAREQFVYKKSLLLPRTAFTWISHPSTCSESAITDRIRYSQTVCEPKKNFHPCNMADGHRFTVNPFPGLQLTQEDRKQLITITHTLVRAKVEEYQDYLVNHKMLDFSRWKKYQVKGNTTTYIERKSSNPTCQKLPASLMVGPLPGSLDENMFGLVSPTLESMRIKSSYLNDFNAAAVLATIVEPSVDEPFRSIVVKWMEIDTLGASTGLTHNRDYVYVEATGIQHLDHGDRVGYHLWHSVTFPATHDLPNRIRGNMSLCAVFHEEVPRRTNCRGTGILDPSGDVPPDFCLQGVIHATMAGLKYSYCAQMKKLTWLVEQKHTQVSGHGTPEIRPECVSCRTKVKGFKSRNLGRNKKTCTLCLQAVCGSCQIVKRLSFISVDNEMVIRKMKFCSLCILRASQLDTQEAARVQFVYKHSITSTLGGGSVDEAQWTLQAKANSTFVNM